MSLVYGSVRVILRLATNPDASHTSIDEAIEVVSTLQPGLRLHGHDPRTGEWTQVGTITRVWREGREICQEADIDPGAQVDRFPPVYIRVDVIS